MLTRLCPEVFVFFIGFRPDFLLISKCFTKIFWNFQLSIQANKISITGQCASFYWPLQFWNNDRCVGKIEENISHFCSILACSKTSFLVIWPLSKFQAAWWSRRTPRTVQDFLQWPIEDCQHHKLEFLFVPQLLVFHMPTVSPLLAGISFLVMDHHIPPMSWCGTSS